jgi:hypothetical protein
MHDTKGARATKRFGSATWNGDLREGKGSVSTESRALESHPYTFFSRYGGKPGTNPDHARRPRAERFDLGDALCRFDAGKPICLRRGGDRRSSADDLPCSTDLIL